ncbi:MAG: hypothetical protein RPR40_10110 [Bermanella sp.]|jgi:hypothetical protein
MRMPASELDRWLHFFQHEPAGFIADNWRAGITTASILNAMMRLPSYEALKPSDIFPNPHENTAPKPANPKKVQALFVQLKQAKTG